MFTRYICFKGVSFATKGKSGTFKLYMTKVTRLDRKTKLEVAKYVGKKGVDAFRVLHFFSPRSDEILCLKSVAEGYLVSLSPRPDSVVITLNLRLDCVQISRVSD